MRVVQVVVKNTSTLDFTLPVLRRLGVEADITVLYCALNRTQIVRRSRLYSSLVAECGGIELDYADFLRPAFRPLRGLIRRVFSSSPADKLHLRALYRSQRDAGSGRTMFSFVQTLMARVGILSLLGNMIRNVTVHFEERLVPYMVDLGSILPRLAPNIVLFDNRTSKLFAGWSQFRAFFERTRTPVVLLPHAPHYRTPTGEFCALDDGAFPDYCEHWSPMRFGTPEEAPGADADRIARVGYPGLDSDWLAWLRGRQGPTTTKGDGKTLRCLFIIRRYIPENQIRAPDLDPYIVDYDDFAGPTAALAAAIESLGGDVDVVVKPHPSNDYFQLRRDLARSPLKRWQISYEPIYAELAATDIVVSLFSTILLVPAMAGIPTVVIETALQQHVHDEWPLLERLYTGLSYYVKDLQSLPDTLQAAVHRVRGGHVLHDDRHLRKFFPDGATSRATDRVQELHRRSSAPTPTTHHSTPT